MLLILFNQVAAVTIVPAITLTGTYALVNTVSAVNAPIATLRGTSGGGTN